MFGRPDPLSLVSRGGRCQNKRRDYGHECAVKAMRRFVRETIADPSVHGNLCQYQRRAAMLRAAGRRRAVCWASNVSCAQARRPNQARKLAKFGQTGQARKMRLASSKVALARLAGLT